MNDQIEKKNIKHLQKKVLLVIYIWFFRNKCIPVDLLVTSNFSDLSGLAHSQYKSSLLHFSVKNSSVCIGAGLSTSKATIPINNNSKY